VARDVWTPDIAITLKTYYSHFCLVKECFMRQKTAGERIESIRGDMSQAEFGKLLDSSQGAVSAWERDDKDRSPSAAIYLRLAALANDPDDAVFFLEQGGVPSQAVISVANALLKKGGVKVDTILATAEALLNDQLGDQRDREKEGKDFIVPPLGEADRLPFDVCVAAPLVSNQASTFYIVAPSEAYKPVGHGVAPGEIIVFERRELSSYEENIGEKVVTKFKDGIFVGRLGYVGEATSRHLVIGPADVPPNNWALGKGSPARIILSFGDIDPMFLSFRQKHEVSGLFGIWVAQFSTGVHAFWKKMAHIHGPKR
jgi:DNA-binding transcriptional regulator YiaG